MDKFLTKTELKERGWSEGEIKEFLGKPDDSYWNKTYEVTVKLYDLERVELNENSSLFQHYHSRRRSGNPEALKKWKAWKEQVKRIKFRNQRLEDKNKAILWARNILEEDNFIILDTETTGFDAGCIIEIAVIASKKNILIDTLVRPYYPIEKEAQSIHGISEKDCENAPTFLEISDQLREILEGKTLLIYNLNFDWSCLEWDCIEYEIPLLNPKKKDCLMLWYSQFVGDWHDYYRNYTWQPLEGGHRALADCYAAYDCLIEMAESEIKELLPLPEKP